MKWQSNIYLTSSFNKVLVAKMHLKDQRILSICEAENFAEMYHPIQSLNQKKSIQGVITF